MLLPPRVRERAARRAATRPASRATSSYFDAATGRRRCPAMRRCRATCLPLRADARRPDRRRARRGACSARSRVRRERVQFGKPIGNFQAVQQQLAVFGTEVAAVGCAGARRSSARRRSGGAALRDRRRQAARQPRPSTPAPRSPTRCTARSASRTSTSCATSPSGSGRGAASSATTGIGRDAGPGGDRARRRCVLGRPDRRGDAAPRQRRRCATRRSAHGAERSHERGRHRLDRAHRHRTGVSRRAEQHARRGARRPRDRRGRCDAPASATTRSTTCCSAAPGRKARRGSNIARQAALQRRPAGRRCRPRPWTASAPRA